jgi:hypothetical protein
MRSAASCAPLSTEGDQLACQGSNTHKDVLTHYVLPRGAVERLLTALRHCDKLTRNSPMRLAINSVPAMKELMEATGAVDSLCATQRETLTP